MSEEIHEPAYIIFLRNDKTGDISSISATRFQHVTSQDLRHWVYPHHTIIGRAVDKAAELFDFPPLSEVVDHISAQGYSIRHVDTSPLSPQDKLSELLYVSLSRDKDIRHPIANALILGTDNLMLLVVNFGSVLNFLCSLHFDLLAKGAQDPTDPDGTLPDTLTIDKVMHPVIGRIRDGEPSFIVVAEDLKKYLQTDNVIYHRYADLVERDVKEARAAEKAEKKVAKRRAQKEKRSRAQKLVMGGMQVKSGGDHALTE